VQVGEEAQWRTLWGAYCDFYQEPVAEEVTAHLWNRLLDESSVVKGVIAVDEAGTVLGFAHYVLHPHTWSNQDLCYLEDLFVSPNARGQGIATHLINHLVETGRRENWRRVYWHTNTDNETARRMYDRFTLADPYVRYTVSL
jgi:GNAT superfamily N-acetyltransferase